MKDEKGGTGCIQSFERKDLLTNGAKLIGHKPHSLQVAVKDKEGNSIEGAEVNLTVIYGRSGGSGGKQTTDSSGLAVFEVYDGGTYSWNARAKGYCPKSSDYPQKSVGSDDWKDQVELVLEKADLVRGRVVDAEGDPVSGCTVTVAAYTHTEAKTDSDGNFDLYLPQQREVRTEYYGQDTVALMASTGREAFGVFAGMDRQKLIAEGITLTIKPARKFTMIVKDPKGKPIQKVELLAFGPAGGSPSLWTDKNGKAVREGAFEGGPYVLIVRKDGYYCSSKTELPILGGPDWKDPVELVMEPTNRTQTGVVVDHEGKPVAGAEVSAYTDKSLKAVTDAEGRFTLKGLPNCPVSVYATRPSPRGYGSASASKDTPSITITLPKPESN